MGNCNVPEHLDKEILNLLSKFDAISLRENKAVNYIQSLFKETKEIFHAPDPTFLLDSKQYENLISDEIANKSFITTYSLAEYGEEQLQIVNYIKRKLKAEIYVIFFQILWNDIYHIIPKFS